MLTNRQIKILQHLLIHSFYGTELAKVMKTSRRTIIRDISTIDDWLRENNYGYIDSSKKYLIVTKRDKALKIEIQKLKVQKYRILYQLLSCKNISISEITEKFFSSKRDIESIIKNLNEEYRHLFTISIQPRKGILISLSTYERINLIASLLFSFVNLNIDTYEAKKNSYLYLENIRHTKIVERILRYETETQLCLQIQAYYICLANNLLSIDFQVYLEQKLNKLDKIEKFKLIKILSKMNHSYNIDLDIEICATTIEQHLKRTIVFPSYFEGDMNEQFEKMRIKYPFIFEFAEGIAEELQHFLSILYIDGQFVALYMINALKHENNSVDLIMYEERYSISNINNKLIEAQVKNAKLRVIHSKDELSNISNSNKLDKISVIIVDSNQATKMKNLDIDYLFEGILSNEDLQSIQIMIDSKKISHEIQASLGEEDFTCVTVKSNFMDTLSDGLEVLKRNGLTNNQIDAIKRREEAGNQLIIGELSVPHIQAEIAKPFKLFYLKLDKKVAVYTSKVAGILIVIVNGSSNEYTQLFSYLYDHLKDIDLKIINSKEDLLQVLL